MPYKQRAQRLPGEAEESCPPRGWLASLGEEKARDAKLAAGRGVGKGSEPGKLGTCWEPTSGEPVGH